MIYSEHTILFAAPDDEQAIIDARQYITEMSLTKDNAKLVRREEQILVITKQEVEL